MVTSERSRQSSINKVPDLQSDSECKLNLQNPELSKAKYVSKWLEDDNHCKQSSVEKLTENEVGLNYASEKEELKDSRNLVKYINSQPKRRERKRTRKYFKKLGFE